MRNRAKLTHREVQLIVSLSIFATIFFELVFPAPAHATTLVGALANLLWLWEA